MIAKRFVCTSCGAEANIDSWRRFVVCKYCGKQEPFEGFKYIVIDPTGSEFASVKKVMDCPRCRSKNMFFYGRKWKCSDCGYILSERERRFGVFWFCDECDAFLNTQKGFSQKNGKWKCTECGFESGVSKTDIL